MQNAKDTFYAMLQGRLAAINPARTIVVRGLVRPGTLVDENELPTAALATDVFHLRWTGLQVDRTSSLPLAAMECSILYATDGTSGNGGMDRGRLLAAMDAELASALGAAPHSTVKSNYAAAGVGVAPVAMGTDIFWGDPVFGAVGAVGERLQRTVSFPVYAYEEAGEL